jgi:hypothetical protein
MPEGSGSTRDGSLIFVSSPILPLAPEFIQPVADMSTGRFLAVKRGRRVRLTTLTAIYEPIF